MQPANLVYLNVMIVASIEFMKISLQFSHQGILLLSFA